MCSPMVDNVAVLSLTSGRSCTQKQWLWREVHMNAAAMDERWVGATRVIRVCC